MSHTIASPMQGVRVLDCATFIAGPACATFLGEFGAEVIKVELPKIGCPLRKFGTPTEGADTLPWMSESRNKQSLTLDLRTPEGAAILKDLVSQADILVENFQPGTMEEWGVGWEALHACNPRLVMVRISAYGQTGPYRDRPGFGRIANAFGGLSYLAGYPDRAPVTPGAGSPSWSPDGRWIAIACTNDKIFARFAEVAGHPELAGGGKWGTTRQREADRATVDAFVTDWTMQHDLDDALSLCADGQVPCGPLLSIDQIFADPHYAARENLKTMHDPRAGDIVVPNVVPRLSVTPGHIDHLGPALGSSTDAILSDLLHMPSERIAALREKGVI